MTFPCIKYKIHKYTITQICKYTNTKCLKDPTCAIFLKSIGFKDIKYDIQTASHVKPVVENVRKTVPDMKLCV